MAQRLGSAARFERLDVSLEGDWADAMARIDALDILVNNAGITTLGSIEDVTLEQFRHEFEIDVVGVFLGCKAGVAKMKVNSGGSIINMSSMTGVRAQADLVAYNGAKAAVTHMTKSVAMHCAKPGYGIRCNSVHPGAIHTPIIDKVLAQSDDPEAFTQAGSRCTPSGGSASPKKSPQSASISPPTNPPLPPAQNSVSTAAARFKETTILTQLVPTRPRYWRKSRSFCPRNCCSL